jgi:hypothetical protein
LSATPTRFEVAGLPGAMSAYFAEAGIEVPDEQTLSKADPPGPSAVQEIAARWGIEFWTGPIDTTPLTSSP